MDSHKIVLGTWVPVLEPWIYCLTALSACDFFPPERDGGSRTLNLCTLVDRMVKRCLVKTRMSYTDTLVSFLFFFFLFGRPAAYGVPRAGIRSEPQLQPPPQLWQHQILNSQHGLGIEPASQCCRDIADPIGQSRNSLVSLSGLCLLFFSEFISSLWDEHLRMHIGLEFVVQFRELLECFRSMTESHQAFFFLLKQFYSNSSLSFVISQSFTS